MLLPRVLSALVGIPLALILVYLNGILFVGAIVILAMIGLWEFSEGMKKLNIFVIKPIAFLAVFLGLIGTNFYHDRPFSLFLVWAIIWFIILFGSMTFHIFYRRSSKETPPPFGWRVTSIGTTMVSVLYFGMFAFLILLRNLSIGRDLVFLLLFTVWVTDITAYFIGLYAGKTKLAPKVSPGKTLEGSIGGIIAGVISAVLVSKILPVLPAGVSLNLSFVLPLGFAISVVGQVGDFCKSVIKRDIGVKDFGSLIPGHGGVLDRFDSLLITAPLAYFYFQVMSPFG